MKAGIATFFLLLPVFLTGQDEQVDSILKQIYFNLSESDSWQYSGEYQFKSLFNKDTNTYQGWVSFVKNKEDTLLGANATYLSSTKMVRFYSQDTCLKIFPKYGEYEIITEDTHLIFEGNSSCDIVLPRLLYYRPDRTFETMTKDVDSIFFQDGQLVLRDLIPMEQDTQFSGFYYDYFFDTTLMAPVAIESRVFYLNTYEQYQYWRLYDHAFTFPEPEEPVAEERIPLAKLEVGASLPLIELRDTTGSVIDRDDLRGKVVLLDFWYVSCYPCQLAMPGIQYLHETFDEDEVLIYGVNPIDKDNDAMKRLFDKRGLDYPILVTEKSMASEIGVQAYPTFILLDQDGKVVSFHEGFSEGFEKETEEEIRDLLEK